MPFGRPFPPPGDACCGPGLAGRRRLLTCVSATADGDYAPLPQPLVFAQVPGTGIHYTIGHPGVPDAANEGHTSNAGFVVTDEGVVVFDTLGTPSLGWALLQRIRQVTDQPVRYVVLSHYHADHIYGLQAFRDHTKAVIVAQMKALDYTAEGNTDDEQAVPRLAQRRQALAPWVNARTRIVEPRFTIQQAAEIRLGGHRFDIAYAGPAHSMSDVMMMVQPENVLFAGDIVQNGRIPFMASAAVNTGNWLRGLRHVAEMRPSFVVPGHGKPSTDAEQAIGFTHDYIMFVRAAMQKAVQDWATFDDAYAGVDWGQYARMPAFQESNRGNAYRVFLEMEKAAFGKP